MRTFKSAYAAGLNAGKVKPNTSNCHFSWFSSKESTAEWERGNREGKNHRAKRFDNPVRALAGEKP
jgi:hypothetical protein